MTVWTCSLSPLGRWQYCVLAFRFLMCIWIRLLRLPRSPDCSVSGFWAFIGAVLSAFFHSPNLTVRHSCARRFRTHNVLSVKRHQWSDVFIKVHCLSGVTGIGITMLGIASSISLHCKPMLKSNSWLFEWSLQVTVPGFLWSNTKECHCFSCGWVWTWQRDDFASRKSKRRFLRVHCQQWRLCWVLIPVCCLLCTLPTREPKKLQYAGIWLWEYQIRHQAQTSYGQLVETAS